MDNLETFEANMRNPMVSDQDVKNEFYDLAKGVTLVREGLMLHLLEQYRPVVFKQVKQELGRIY